MRTIVRVKQKADYLGSEVRLFGLRANVLKVLEITGHKQVLQIVTTRQEALDIDISPRLWFEL